jgi:ligand-binding sensor domain-containing protein/two-component sensor histidine kinase
MARYCGPRILAPLVLALGLPTAPVGALDPEKRITQYVLDVWQRKEGLPVSKVDSITQTADGYLWLATEEGLVRFDGVRFTTFDRRHASALAGGVVEVFGDRSGDLWIGTNAGVVRWRGGVTASYSSQSLSNRLFRCFAEDQSGALWFCGRNGLNRLAEGRFSLYTTRDGLANDSVESVLAARDGSIWVGTTNGVSRLDQGSVTTYTTENGLTHNLVGALLEDREGSLWIGTFDGLNRFTNGRLSTEVLGKSMPRVPVSDLVEDAEGSLWIATYGGGIGRLRDGRFERFTARDGLPDDLVIDLHLDLEGSLWIATNLGGLARLKDGPFTAYTTREGLSHDSVRAVHEDRDGAIWVATQGGGLNRLGGGAITTFSTADGLMSDNVFALRESADGGLWVGSYNGGLNRFKDGRFTDYLDPRLPKNEFITVIHEGRDGSLWLGTSGGLKRILGSDITTFRVEDGLSYNAVYAITEDRDGSLWIGTGHGLTRWNDGAFTRFSDEDGLPMGSVFALLADADGTLWVGMQGGGLVRMKDDELKAYTTENGLFDNTVYSIVDDGAGLLWMSSNNGVFHVSREDLLDVAEGRRPAVVSVSYGVADGLKSPECNGSTHPSAWRARDGRLWFATSAGVVSVDPEKVRSSGAPPPTVIEEVVVDDRPADRANVEASYLAGPDSRQFELHYTALSLGQAGRLRFRYRLDAVDHDWVDAGPRRAAYYPNVPPGRHRFRVMAGYPGGDWNEAGAAAIWLDRAPHFWETSWFYGLCAAVLGTAGFLGHRYRMRRVLELERVRMRIASDLHDDIGSSLSQIAILSEVVRAQLDGGAAAAVTEPVARIGALSRESVDAMGDIVWAIDPQRDTSTHLVQRMRRLASDLLPRAGIEFRFDVSEDEAVPLGADVRRQVFLVFKETINNILRHADASHVEIEVLLRTRHLRLSVRDNGRGFEPAGPVEGNGLRNLRDRASRLSGDLDVVSSPDEGTTLTLTVPVR